MKLNQKGYMLVELVLSSVLAMTIALYLINLTYQFKNKNEDIYQSITYSKDKIAITKNIMNDLENKKIVSINSPVQKGDTFTIDFQVLVGDNFDSIESRRIKVVKNHEKDNTGKDIATTTTIYYGKINGEDYLKEDVSYYERTLDKTLTVGKIASKYENDYLTLNIPIQSIYSSDTYDIKLLLKCSAIPIIQSVSSGYSEKIWKYKDRITKIVFEDRMNPKKSVGVMSFDVSSLGNGSVMTYLVPDVNNTYIAYIQGDGGVLANQNSSYLFSNFSNLVSIDGLEKLNTSNVTNMGSMFKNCSSLEFLDISHFNTSKVTDMGGMFYNCRSVSVLDVSHFDTSNVSSMADMFYNCRSVSVLDVSHFNTSKVTNMSGMFSVGNTISSLISISNITTKLEVLDLSSFDTSKVTNMYSMFFGADNLKNVIFGSKFNTSNVTNMKSMFAGVNKLKNIDLSHFDTTNVTNMYQLFYRCFSLENLDVSHFNTSNVTNMGSMFEECSSLEFLDVSHFDTSKVTNMSGMFASCTKIKELDVSNFNTSNVTNMGGNVSLMENGFEYTNTGMFFNMTSLEKINVSNFDTSNVTNMNAMFMNCDHLKEIDLSNFNTSKVENMEGMFRNLNYVETLNLCSFNTLNAMKMAYMFSKNTNLKNVYVSSKWLYNKNADVTGMFKNSGVSSVTYGQCS